MSFCWSQLFVFLITLKYPPQKKKKNPTNFINTVEPRYKEVGYNKTLL